MTEQQEIKAFLEKTMLTWAAEFIKERKDELRRKKIEASGDLIKSLEAKINKDVSAQATEILLMFPDYGRIVDMKNTDPANGGEDTLEGIERWINKKGKAKFISAWQKKYMRKTVPANVVNQIAWGILIKRAKGKNRRRNWYNKPKGVAITDLYNRVVAGLPEMTGKQVAKSFKNGNS